MTLQLRPTFSESWYRVVNLKPRLRPSAQISRQHYRGERWYVMRDPAGNQFHRLSDAAYRFVGLLDGTRTVGEAWELVGGTLADDAPTQPEVIQILSQLYAANLIETDVPPDAQVLLRRHKKQQQRKIQQRAMNLLFPRFPIWDPDRFLVRWLPVVKPFLSIPGGIIWLAVVGGAIFMLLPEWDRIKSATMSSIAPGNWFWLWAVFVLTKFLHELGHAFSCRRFGGEVHEVGIMFLVLIPTPYVDASTSWGFPSKWKRLFVGAAGMIVELFVAAVCAILWLHVTPDSLPSQLLFNAMLIASVSTVLFNANPLLRYDGYYMLSDYLEIPNLQMRSREYVLGLIKRHIFRIKARDPLPPPVQRVQLFLYGVLSSIYRIFIGFVILIMVLYQLPEEIKIVGLFLAAGALATFLVIPQFKLFKYLALDPELHRKRGRAWAFTLSVIAAIVIFIGLLRFDVNVYATGVLEPQNRAAVFVRTPGFVERIHARDGQMLQAGDIILVASDPQLQTRIAQLQAQLQRLEIAERHSWVRGETPGQAYIVRFQMDSTRKALADAQRQLDELTIRAPIDGQLVMPRIHQYPGRYLQRGEQLAMIQRDDTLMVRATVDQRDAELVARANENARAEVRLAGNVAQVLHAMGFSVSQAAQDRLPHAALGYAGGGEIATAPGDEEGTRPASRQFELQVRLSNLAGSYHPGQRAYVRLKLDSKPLAWQWTRRLLQLIQSSTSGKALG